MGGTGQVEGTLRYISAWILVLMAMGACHAEWQVETSVDKLDPKQKRVFARVEAKAPFLQFNKAVTTNLVAVCGRVDPAITGGAPFKQIAVGLFFSDPVAIGERQVRWRVDQHPVESRKQFYNDGMAFHLTSAIARSELPKQLQAGKLLRVDADLPWAGQTLIEFDISNGGAALAQIPCK